MAIIEGVGDEVTVLFALVLILIVLALAWVSTHTAERGHSPWVPPVIDSTEASNGIHLREEQTDPRTSTSLHSDSRGDIGADGEQVLNTDCPPPNANTTASDNEPPDTPISTVPSNNDAPASINPTLRPSDGDDHAGGADSIVLRLKFLNDTERPITVRLSDTVLQVKRTHFPGQEERVRLIYQGQLLRDDTQTVSSLQLRNGSVLHCHISQHASVPGAMGAEMAQVPLNIGSLLVPLLGLILGMLWYCQLQYPHFFTASATACLGVVTLLVSAIAFSSYRR
ncbi:transmembrane and ubiquitin-like domain-containing protein 1 isoform 1-T4 [Discoglossus pictus]